MNHILNYSTWELSQTVLNLKPTWATQLDAVSEILFQLHHHQ